MEQPLEFKNDTFPHCFFKLDKVLYYLKQVPRAWYEELISFPLENGFERGKVDITLFLKTMTKSLC